MDHLAKDLALFSLESPGRVDASTPRACESLLENSGPDEQSCRQALLAMAAIAYVRPDLVSERSVSAVESLLRISGLPPPVLDLAGSVLISLMSTPVASLAVEATLRGLLEPGCASEKYNALMRALEHAAFWSLPLVTPAQIIALSQCAHLATWRHSLIGRVVEPFVFAAPEAVTVPLLDDVKRLEGPRPAPKYFLYYLAQRDDVRAEVRRVAAGSIKGHFSQHKKVRRRLGRDAKRVLVVQNIKDAQGDEIIRCVPLLQALLDFNPQLCVVLITARAYLYAHPRLEAVSIRDEAGVAEVLAEPSDAVIDFFEPQVLEVNYDVALEKRIRQHVLESAPFLYVTSKKGFNRFTYERVDIGNRPYAATLGLDVQRVENIYETTFRLAAELGLPLRSGEQEPVSEPVLAGLPSRAAVAAWGGLNARNVAARPVALLNPFGGAEPLKGHVARKLDSLAERMRSLIEEGFYVVLLPNGTPWGSADQARAAVMRLSRQDASYVAIAPDPAGEGTPPRVGALSLSYADYRMRLVTYFVRFADLVVTVEGWMAHAAYCLGKRYRVLMLPYSYPPEWHPYGRTRRQDVVQTHGRGMERPADEDGSAPPLPDQPRKHTLVALLGELGEVSGERALPFLRKALTSEDRDVRLAAARSVARLHDPHVADDLVALLDDTSARVRVVAAEGLLERNLCSPPHVEGVPRDHLLAHQLIGQPARNWASVVSLGETARAALEFALKDDDPVIRREARQVLHMLDVQARRSKPDVAAREVGEGRSSSKRQLLYVSPVIPDLTGNGLAMRAGMVLQALAGLYEVSLLVPQLYPPFLDTVPEAIGGLCRAAVVARGLPAPIPAALAAPLRRRWFGLRRAAAQHFRWPVDQAASAFRGTSFDVVHVFRLAMLPYARPYFRATDGEPPKRHLDLDDIESVTRRGLAALYRSNGAHPMALYEERKAEEYRALEDEVLSSFDRVYVCSTQDRERLHERSRAELRVLPNAVRVPTALPDAPADQPFTCLFLGTLGYYPNEDGVRYLCSEILPHVRQQAGRALRVNIVGTGGRDSLRQMVAESGAQFIGAVPNVEDWYRTANAVVVPIRAGGGTRIKVLEAFAYRRPVVTTSVGIEGIDARDGEHVLVADTPESFAECCVRLMNDRELVERLTGNAHQLFLRAYTPDVMRGILTRFGNVQGAASGGP